MFVYLRQFMMALLFTSSFSCEALENLVNIETFQEAWRQFLQSKNIIEHQIGSEDYREHEFSLLTEFTVQQGTRYRPYIETVDRYKGCRPYSENRISLADGTEMSASFIQFTNFGKDYQNFIATQAPFKHNTPIFWQMILEHHIDQIVMVTELVEAERPTRELAHPYWPEKIGERMVLENGLEVTLIEESELLPDLKEKIQIRKFQLCGQGQEKIVTHYWYRNWIDNTAPEQLQTLSTLMETVAQDKCSEKLHSPLLVHCSAGIGRTGVFIAFYHLMQRKKYDEHKINLFDLIAYLRWQRPYLVGNFTQYNFCYRVHAGL